MIYDYEYKLQEIVNLSSLQISLFADMLPHRYAAVYLKLGEKMIRIEGNNWPH